MSQRSVKICAFACAFICFFGLSVPARAEGMGEGAFESLPVTVVTEETEFSPEPTDEPTAEPSVEPELTPEPVPDSAAPAETPAPEPTPELAEPDPGPSPDSREAFLARLEAAGFPASYREPLWQLHRQYPSWDFRVLRTGVDWSTAVREEAVLGRSLVWSGAPSSWKSIQEGAYNWTDSTWYELDSGGWVAASEGIIAHYMDPRNSLDSSAVFQFLYQGFDAETQTIETLSAMTGGTFLSNTELDTDADLSNGVTTYLAALMEAGRAYGVNPCVLASMMIQEMGTNGNSQSITGTNARFPGYYNAFNIGAYKAPGFTAVERGLWYASGGNNGSGTSYGRPWNSLYKAILGGAQFYAANYVSLGQNTLYLKRFNVQGSNMYRNQYMTNVAGARSEGQLLSRAYSESMRAMPLIFSIPVFENMPAAACPAPGGDGSPNAKLAALALEGAAIAPEFSRDVREYTAIVSEELDRVTVTAVPLYAGATVTGTGEHPIAPGENRLVITVTAENGAGEEYVIRVVRREGETPPAVTQPVEVATPPPEPTPALRLTGDVTGDGAVRINDLIRVRNHLLGTAPLTGVDLTAADADKNGQVQINDLIKIRNFLLGTGTLPQ